jgi:hypothetical protein
MTKGVLTIATLAAVWSLNAVAATPIDRRIDADADGRLEVHNIAGSIEITGWTRREVQVTGELGDSVERLDVLAEGDRVIVRVVLRDNSHSRDGTHLVISAPQDSELDVNAVSASISVRGIQGEQRLASVSGRIDTETFERELTARTVSGGVRVDGHDRPALTRANAVSGHVILNNVSGEVYAQSVSGHVELTGDSLERAQVNSISGHVRVRSGLTERARIEATTTSGNVTLVFAGDAAADYQLVTFSGGIDNGFGPPPPQSPRGGPRREHRFRQGTSEARVHATTMSGSIDLCRE